MIIDLYYINKDGEIVLIDFKSDNVNDEQEILNRYALQLKIYREALEKRMQKKVKKTIIYSTKFNKYINID